MSEMLKYKYNQGGGKYHIYEHNKKKETDWIGHILRRNCLQKHVIDGKISKRLEVTGRRGRRRK